ncbi:JAB domain-containing protein [Acetobacter thailandicus]|uniref:JAB domain-containing protein n=1 Tax=Acetobacter thailandicus TaxID=1502842 RepID=UPI001BA6D850|nr:DNA repair protein RadC [Acetobacter thailandicus]MBS1002622.1 DNA repair protein RadC [Acetobacter thailandicus]
MMDKKIKNRVKDKFSREEHYPLRPAAEREANYQSFAAAGGEVDDAQLLQAFLRAIAPDLHDSEKIVVSLMARFGSLVAILSASAEELSEELKKHTALIVYFQLIREAVLRSHLFHLKKEGVRHNTRWLYAYLRVMLSQEGREQARVLFFDSAKCLLAEKLMGQGTVDTAPVYPREVVHAAVNCKAQFLVLSHNHPSGDPSPSSDDLALTRHIQDAARLMNITVLDHIIVGQNSFFSFCDEGLL